MMKSKNILSWDAKSLADTMEISKGEYIKRAEKVFTELGLANSLIAKVEKAKKKKLSIENLLKTNYPSYITTTINTTTGTIKATNGAGVNFTEGYCLFCKKYQQVEKEKKFYRCNVCGTRHKLVFIKNQLPELEATIKLSNKRIFVRRGKLVQSTKWNWLGVTNSSIDEFDIEPIGKFEQKGVVNDKK